MAKWRKKPLLVTAEVLTSPQYVTTLEGVSEGKVGDYLVTGVDNEQWVVRPQWFKDSYKHVKGNTYQRISQVLEAEQIDEPQVVPAPTGPIKGDKGDYKVTGAKGERWFVKPDIFIKTYEKVGKSMDKTGLQKAIDQLGLDAVQRYLPKGMKINNCDMHGSYLSHYTQDQPICPLCITHNPAAEGTTATEVEHYLDIRDGINPYTDRDGF